MGYWENKNSSKGGGKSFKGYQDNTYNGGGRNHRDNKEEQRLEQRRQNRWTAKTVVSTVKKKILKMSDALKNEHGTNPISKALRTLVASDSNASSIDLGGSEDSEKPDVSSFGLGNFFGKMRSAFTKIKATAAKDAAIAPESSKGRSSKDRSRSRSRSRKKGRSKSKRKR